MIVEVKVISNLFYHISVWHQNHSKSRCQRACGYGPCYLIQFKWMMMMVFIMQSY